jgi:amino acid transporter
VSEPAAGAPSVGLLFAIFFPAVTGFTAGVNMSGDLKNPKKSIPSGTILAIVVGAVVYFGLAVFLGQRVPRDMLVNDADVLKHIAMRPSIWPGFGACFVLLGIFGATLSSAIGSIMGAPRILQALGRDAIAPRLFAKGHGKTNEPRNALVLAFLIAESGILIAELNAIAEIVSMVFLATYLLLNLSFTIESWASPDFRPEFRPSKLFGIVGAVFCIFVMVNLNVVAMAGALVLMSVVYLLLKRRQLRLESGDTWEGVWASLVRAGLFRLGLQTLQRRNWRPNVLLFAPAEAANTRTFASSPKRTLLDQRSALSLYCRSACTYTRGLNA